MRYISLLWVTGLPYVFLVTLMNDRICYSRAALIGFSSHAQQVSKLYLSYQHSEIGYNYRMSYIVAGIGRGQI